MGVQMGVFLTYAGMIILIFLIGKIFLWPLKLMLKLAANSLIGGLAILVINAIGTGFGIFIPLNMVSALVVGVLGIPGAVLLLII
ncbi:MAG: pro-sigmaK processing inhibitor BofA family protein [Firmicutes bacterium]|nr:pro-sigmaK processing inhibitor BofA family protein [Bacillota bacterium]MBR3706225.1 pro-sigmaK processing inhibitor BofA family protein [Bacillota bacterium]MBR6585633.1 pro-sigmaK processing inhibitor BofA family protein [Bacillota bacterium]